MAKGDGERWGGGRARQVISGDGPKGLERSQSRKLYTLDGAGNVVLPACHQRVLGTRNVDGSAGRQRLDKATSTERNAEVSEGEGSLQGTSPLTLRLTADYLLSCVLGLSMPHDVGSAGRPGEGQVTARGTMCPRRSAWRLDGLLRARRLLGWCWCWY